jgi:hypothetical protein
MPLFHVRIAVPTGTQIGLLDVSTQFHIHVNNTHMYFLATTIASTTTISIMPSTALERAQIASQQAEMSTAQVAPKAPEGLTAGTAIRIDRDVDVPVSELDR